MEEIGLILEVRKSLQVLKKILNYKFKVNEGWDYGRSVKVVGNSS